MDRPGEPTIRECVPTAGPVGSKVTIYGANFGTFAAGRVVSFNSVVAEEYDANTEGGVDGSLQKTRFRGKEDQKNLQSKQAPAGAVEETEKKDAERKAGERPNNDLPDAGKPDQGLPGKPGQPGAPNQDLPNQPAAGPKGELGKRDVDQKNAAANAAAVTGPAQTSAAKQPGDVAAQTQGAGPAGGAVFPAVERGEAEHGVSGAASQAVVTHRQGDPSGEETITVIVPEGATPGDIVVTVNGIASNGSRFTVTAV